MTNKMDETKSKEGVFMMVDKKDLFVDPAYQRDVNSKGLKVVEIARNWDWLLCGVLRVVMREDGTFWVVDGQHRTLGALHRDDITFLPCMVFEVEGLSAEASAFVGANTRKSTVSGWVKHKAGLVAKEPTAVRADELVRSVGYSIDTVPNGRNTVRCIMTLHRMIVRNEEAATRAVKLAAEIANGDYMMHTVLEGLFWIGIHTDDIWKATHRNRLIGLGQEVIDNEISKRRMIVGKGGQKLYGEAITMLCNKQRRSKKLALYED